MKAIKDAFAECKAQNRAAMITYVTAGFPTISETPDIMLAMQAGGADIIQLGIPFTGPTAESHAIKLANLRALENGVQISYILHMVQSARKRGLAIPVLFIGYYNPVRSYPYGEEKLLRECKAAGVDGLTIVDLLPKTTVGFRDLCKSKGLSYIPLIASSTSDAHMKLLCNIADSFVCIASRMGVSGTHEEPYETHEEPYETHEEPYGCVGDLLHRVHACTGNPVPVAVGFGIETPQHFVDIGRLAEGVVIGSQIIQILGTAVPGNGARKVREYCLEIADRTWDQNVVTARGQQATQPLSSTTIYLSNDGANDAPEDTDKATNPTDTTQLRAFRDQYVPTSLTEGLTELENGFEAANADPTFWAEINSYATYANRPSTLHLAPRLTAHAGGARIWLKREDLNHTGSHKINNALGQIVLARRLGKTSIIAETGAGQHGVATATLCAQFGMNCTIFMGSQDFECKDLALTILRMRILGAEVVPVDAPRSGEKGTLRDAVNEAFSVWARGLKTTHFIIGSAFGPHPYPTIVRTFQTVIGTETRVQFGAADGDASMAGQNSASLDGGPVRESRGLQISLSSDEDWEVDKIHFVSSGLYYPGVGPELLSWKESGRVRFVAANDSEALTAFSLLCQLEGIMPALESSYAIAGGMRVAKELGPERDVVVCLSGQGDKDVQALAQIMSTMSTLALDDEI
ncbi:hypothetical protein N7519_003946 [Penicillium mononematosum]|uniref:uncharacterized protein n=1 Tax=Penicillium mononematosum TaxID=268346 RepID=UPI002546BF65|nr:uncharacterized protein N7519_003946 [Penicillium mononematosum]KAJ6189038.1 hypothetical protein N7519_003946 [Penicillium mononematosum]